MKRQIAEFPFEHYYVYGPIWHKTERRNMVVLVKIGCSKTKTSMSYARYRLSILSKRRLNDGEEADHINGCKWDDRDENLQILSKTDNIKKHSLTIPKRMVRVRCPNCYLIFERAKNQTHLVKGGQFTSCGRRCAGILKRKLQLGESIDISANIIEEFEKNKMGI